MRVVRVHGDHNYDQTSTIIQIDLWCFMPFEIRSTVYLYLSRISNGIRVICIFGHIRRN